VQSDNALHLHTTRTRYVGGFRQLGPKFRQVSKICGSVLVLIVCSGCASSGDGAPYVTPLTVRAIALYVRPAEPPVGYNTKAWRDVYIDAYNTGTPIFDSYRRKPGHARTITDVDCQSTERISVSFFLDKSQLSAGARKSTITLRVIWHTPSTEPDESIVEYYEGPVPWSPLAHKTHEDIYSAGLLFSRHEPFDGIYTVVISYRGNELYRDAFNLVGCKTALRSN